MVKVSKGMWEVAPGTVVDWAVETFKAEVKQDSLRVVCVCKD
jgi:alpha-D-xyloside xylohydrolase